MSWDPRSHRRYIDASAAYITSLNGQPVPCAICGALVATDQPRTSRWGPTIEHNPPVRDIVAMSRSRAEAVALVASPTTWAGIAHRHCQNRQGQQAVTEINRTRNQTRATAATMAGASRRW